jgi:hypothetical protein
MKRPLVKVTWIESAEPYSGWERITTLEAPASLECVSVGFLVSDGKQSKTVAPHVTSPMDERTQGCGIIVIPTQAVVSIEKLAVIG